MHDFLYMEADGKCKWQQQEDYKYVCQENADLAEEEGKAEDALPA